MLFDKTRDFNDDAYRNIVSLRTSVDLFDDLTGGDEFSSKVAIAAEMRVKAEIPSGIINRGFHYTMAIEYPFIHEPYLSSRYGDGTFGVWYGSLNLDTSIYETAFHMIQDELHVSGIAEPIIRERAVYLLHCRAVLIDLSGKRKSHPELVAEHYSYTHQIAERVHKENHPGMLVPSARCQGTNLVAFTASILSDPRVDCYLTYTCEPMKRKVSVERAPGETLLSYQM